MAKLESSGRARLALLVSIASLLVATFSAGVSWYYNNESKKREESVIITGREVEESKVASDSPIQMFLRNEGLRDVQSMAIEYSGTLISIGKKLELPSGGMDTLTLNACELASLSASKDGSAEKYFVLVTGDSGGGHEIEIGPRAAKAIDENISSLSSKNLCSNDSSPLNPELLGR